MSAPGHRCPHARDAVRARLAGGHHAVRARPRPRGRRESARLLPGRHRHAQPGHHHELDEGTGPRLPGHREGRPGCVRRARTPGGRLMAGYSGTPLPQKLGIKAGHRVLLVRAPATFELDADGVAVQRRAGRAPYDVVLAFCPDRAAPHRHLDDLPARVTTPGSLWLAWPKKSSGVRTDVDESVVREIGLGAGLVDVKVCAIDDTWSGLKFVRRVRDR